MKHHPLCPQAGEHFSEKSLSAVRQKIMQTVNTQNGNGATSPPVQDMTVVEFWENHYLPYCESGWKGAGMKPSTIRGYRQIWNQHLKNHFATIAVQNYTADMASDLLSSLKTTQGKNTLNHIRTLGSAMFNEAMERKYRTRPSGNPWKGLRIPKDCKDTSPTKHFTLEEADNLVSALKEHPDCQLIIALSFFLGLRPGEIAGLKWEDFDSDTVHIRRSVVLGHVGTPKTIESQAPLPLIDQVRLPLELWRAKCENRTEGWVFENRDGDPIDLHNIINRVIKPHVKGEDECAICKITPEKSGVQWKGLYAGRRGAATFAIDVTNGNYAVAQALLRHKSMTTTLNVYKKAITAPAFKAGMLQLQAAATNGKSRKKHAEPLKAPKLLKRSPQS